jgi:vancomycin permeability regulator SanA
MDAVEITTLFHNERRIKVTKYLNTDTQALGAASLWSVTACA